MKKKNLNWLLALLAALALVFAGACSDDAGDDDGETEYVADDASVEMLNTLHSAISTGATSEITGVSFTLFDSGSFSLAIDYEYGKGGGVTTNDYEATVTITGTYTDKDGTISLAYSSFSDTRTETKITTEIETAIKNLVEGATVTSSTSGLTVAIAYGSQTYRLTFGSN